MPIKDALQRPTDGSQPIGLGLGVGIQNYTCTDAGTFTSAGAVADVFDISCLLGKSIFETIQDKVADTPAGARAVIEAGLSGTTELLGQHYFVSNPAGGINPKFDFTSASQRGDSTAFVTLKKVIDVPAPVVGTVSWLTLDTIDGALAKHVFRVDNAKGVPPTSCKAGETISVNYAAKYWMWK